MASLLPVTTDLSKQDKRFICEIYPEDISDTSLRNWHQQNVETPVDLVAKRPRRQSLRLLKKELKREQDKQKGQDGCSSVRSRLLLA